MSDLLAVYGTLMRGQAYDGRPDVEALLKPVGPCRIPGVLYSEGDYPWLVEADADGAGVRGELYEVPDTAALELLDRYENEDRHTSGGSGCYDRRRMRLLEPAVDAWVYVWVGPPRGEPIDADDWRTWLALRGDR